MFSESTLGGGGEVGGWDSEWPTALTFAFTIDSTFQTW